MSRLNYSEDEDYPGQFALWRGNVNRSLQGKRGQIALKRLHEALLAMPDKRLIARALATPEGDVCAIGAALVHDRPTQSREEIIRELVECDGDLTTDHAPTYYPYMVTWAVVEANDYDFSHLTPEERYTYMLKWIEDRLAGKSIIVSW